MPNVQRNSQAEDLSLTQYFKTFRNHIIGTDFYFESPYGRKQIIYADWAASGRLYLPIESHILEQFGPYMANTHTEANITGTTMTKAYKQARNLIKRHVNADERDILINTGAGMTSAVNKLQRILGLRVPEWIDRHGSLSEASRPIIFVSHMEHHSNQLSWSETIGDVVCIEPGGNGEVDPEKLEQALVKYNHRTCKIGSFTACSNVTGIQTPYHHLARKMHEYGGLCFVDFSASAPYVDINMHPSSPLEQLDAIYFSPHKFLGGPGSSGVLIFNSQLYNNHIPDRPGGGTVSWTNSVGGRQYYTDIEAREDGGTPPILQTIRTALCIQLKERMGSSQIIQRDRELTSILMDELTDTQGIFVLEDHAQRRLGIISFIAHRIHYNLFVRLLNDRFGIQARGGCSCAGPYGHYLLQINEYTSKAITDQLDQGDLTNKPGWIRLSIHPTMTDQEMYAISEAVRSIMINIESWKQDYYYDSATNDWHHIFADHRVNLDELFTF
ncbi:aminotransferase class V-fold PLP-dependent enzyme [Paenibacillus antarcticus]|uniref:Selenocysteine lyase n=1 Tax=Paenibacillus antarcticus TaxID=253703 RepID=A0A168MG07_9BACL|nr:aminotransferase class V-fold PLP-dependent enzyme [Paenibacillus antarcticus]OAB44630.1 selenocysteine lyase [Paenibacillus antarcticus]